MQSFEVHIVYNFLMDYYQNEEIVYRQEDFRENISEGRKIDMR
jgi:hypothetical protein